MSRTTRPIRIRTAASRNPTPRKNHSISTPRLSEPRYQRSRGTHSNASVACHSSSERHFGRARTASGSSHSEYCGLHTLFRSRNPATSRNATCATRGRTGAASVSHAAPARKASIRTATTAFSTVGDSPAARGPSNSR